MVVTIMVIALASCAGMAAAGTYESGPCTARMLNGANGPSSPNGCCADETSQFDAIAISCSGGANTCNVYVANNTRSLTCY